MSYVEILEPLVWPLCFLLLLSAYAVFNWFSKRAFITPSKNSNSHANNGIFYSGFPAPFRKCQRNPAEGQKPVIPFVIGLGKRISPSAIIFAIISVHFDSIKRCTLRTITHIFQKIWKMIPSIAYGYPAPTIIFPNRMIRVFTSPVHFGPRAIEPVVTHTVRSRHNPHLLCPPTSARKTMAGAERAAPYFCGVSTITSAIPIRELLFVFCEFYVRHAHYSKSPKFFPSKINEIECPS